MHYTIERVTKANYNKFEDMVFYRENGYQQKPSNEPIPKQAMKQLDYPDFYIYAVEAEDRFVGWISLVYIPKIGSRWKNQGHIYVDKLWVAPAFRNNGFAKALPEKADEAKAKLNATGTRLYVNTNNPIAQGLYRSCGYIEDGQAMFMEKK